MEQLASTAVRMAGTDSIVTGDREGQFAKVSFENAMKAVYGGLTDAEKAKFDAFAARNGLSLSIN